MNESLPYAEPPVEDAAEGKNSSASSPLSFGQQRLCFLDQMEPGSALYNIPYLVRLRGRLDAGALQSALRAIIGRHESLRTSFALSGSEPTSAVAEQWAFELARIDLGNLERSRREGEMERLVRDEARRPFNLSCDLMLRASLFRLADDDHALILVLHHIAADGWSISVLFGELGAWYAHFSGGGAAELPELPIQYADYAAWQEEQFKGPTLQSMLDFWKGRLAGAPPLLELPADHPRPPVQTYRGAVETVLFPSALLASLNDLSRRQRSTLFMTLLAAFKALLHRMTEREDIVVGSPVAGRDRPETESLIGFFVNFLALRTDLSGDPSFRELMARVRDGTLAAYDHQQMPFERLVEELQPKRNLNHGPLCQVAFVLQNAPGSALRLPGLEVAVEPVYTNTAKFDLTFSVTEEAGGLHIVAEFSTDLFDRSTIQRLLAHYRTLLEGVVANPEEKISRLPILPAAERSLILDTWNATQCEYRKDCCIHQLFAEQAARTPEAVAVVFEECSLTYGELDRRAETLAARLREKGVGPGVIVALCVERSLEMMVGLLAILKAGGAYLPLDPAYPKERLSFMLRDSKAPVLVMQRRLSEVRPDAGAAIVWLDDETSGDSGRTEFSASSAEDLAYVLYTSGSTGQPKGVMITHRNVVNFFAGMDRVLGRDPGVWLAVTSISFDISVLELFWTLARGFKVVILSEEAKGAPVIELPAVSAAAQMDFSLFYFASDDGASGGDKYRLLMEGARFADQHGFHAVWTPERHFHSFGGPYPNPAVTSAAVAAATRQIKIRAGSVVLPLHHPLRVAEEWSVVDNLSQGRAGISFASGWHDGDFTLAPQNYADRKEIMRQGIETVRKLWRGEQVAFTDGMGKGRPVRIYPKPVQRELPVWLTAAGNPDTFRLAGEMGANVLTHLLGQNLDELSGKIEIYRAARKKAGFDPGSVTLALHTFVGDDEAEVRAKVHGPFCEYLLKSLDLLKGLTAELFQGADVKDLTGEEKKILTEHAFNRYYKTSGLMGTPESCRRLLGRLQSIGVNEIACLIDFGVDAESVLKALNGLDRLREEARRAPEQKRKLTVAEQIERHGVTHLQCTPSFARMLLQSPEARRAIGPLRQLLVGGEGLPAALAAELRREVGGNIHNMYGPTETTVWSSSAKVEGKTGSGSVVSLGRPLANQRIYILDSRLQPEPIGVPGELYIGGDGLARGYLHRPDLTGQKFIADPFRTGETIYRTGDLARYRADGEIEFIGRIDQQVKLRGYRIELGEIESVLSSHPAVRNSAVIVREDAPEDFRLVAYVVPSSETPPPPLELREFLRKKLPEHMVPADFVPLAKLPLTPNGKLDRKALPVPDRERPKIEPAASAPKGSLEQSISAIWEEILSIKNPGLDDNFFDLGGHSLLVMRVQSKVRETLGANLSVLKLFQYPTIRTLAQHIAGEKKDPTFLDKIRERPRRRPAAAGRPVPIASGSEP